MAIYKNGEVLYSQCVMEETSHMWMDGMEDVYVYVWDNDTNTIKHIQVGYYGADGCNLMGIGWDIDISLENARKVVKYLKTLAYNEYCKSVIAYKNGVRKGSHVEVIRGRKIPKGTKLEVFWTGERPTYQARGCSWIHDTELIAGCWDESHDKVWIKCEYLKVLDDIKSPNAKERKQFINKWVANEARKYGIDCGR